MGARCVESRHEAEHDPRHQRHRCSHYQDPHVDLDRARRVERQIRRRRGDDRVHAPRCDQHPNGTATDGEDEAFRQHLTKQPDSVRADRRTHGHLVLSQPNLREEEVRRVRTRDEEHEPHSGEQHEERGRGRLRDVRDFLRREMNIPVWFARQRRVRLHPRRERVGNLLLRGRIHTSGESGDANEARRRGSAAS